MGNNSSSLKIPDKNNYFCSYEKQYDYHTHSVIKESVDLSNYINNSGNFIYQHIINQIKSLGYSIKLDVPIIPVYNKKSTIKKIISSIESIGFLSSDYTDRLSDLIFKSKCYFPRIENIRTLLSDENILIAGIVLDEELFKFLKQTYKKDVSDIICIVGYDSENILIKTTWTNETISINNKFVPNLYELWTINIESPENKIISNFN